VLGQLVSSTWCYSRILRSSNFFPWNRGLHS
jgi:hypothetical protein